MNDMLLFYVGFAVLMYVLHPAKKVSQRQLNRDRINNN